MEETDEAKHDSRNPDISNVSNGVKNCKFHDPDESFENFDESLSNSPDKKGAITLRSEEGGRRRKPHRRKQGGMRHNKKWKPYNKLSWSEKKELEDNETRRACLKREERFASGHPVAPYNTTQFLMEEHSKSENISSDLSTLDIATNHSNPNNGCWDGESVTTSADSHDHDDFYDSPNDEVSFIAKDFSETYDNIHAEHVETMSKAELVKDYMDLELRVERLENKLKVYESLNIMEKNPALADVKQNALLDSNMRPLLVDQKLKFENEKLRKDNMDLRRQIEFLRSQTKIA